MIFKEINFLATHSFESITEISNYLENCNNTLPKLKGEKEILWRKYNKCNNEIDKSNILKDINSLTEKVDTIYANKNACSRIINRYEEIKDDYKNEIKSKEKTYDLIRSDKKKKLRER